MTLISSPLCSVLVNGIPSKPYHPSRGIHQGDPLSPFPFIIMVEGLGHIIKDAVQSNNLRGLFVHGSPPITHQQFVDDNMLFGHPSVQEARTFKEILDTFQKLRAPPSTPPNLRFFSSILLFPPKESSLASLVYLKPASISVFRHPSYRLNLKACFLASTHRENGKSTIILDI